MEFDPGESTLQLLSQMGERGSIFSVYTAWDEGVTSSILLNSFKPLPICLSMSAASSGVARGITPGSLKLVLNNVAMTNINNSTPTSGIANVISLARYTQLKIKREVTTALLMDSDFTCFSGSRVVWSR